MDRDPGDQRRASLRASDADRERFVETLRQHHVDGRLTADELAERTERAYALLLGWQTFYVWYSPARFDDRPRRRSR